MYMHMCGHGCGQRRETHSESKSRRSGALPTLAQTHQGHNPHRSAQKQSKDKHKKSPPPRRRVDPDHTYATRARARSPTDPVKLVGQKRKAHPLARLDEDAIIDPILMVVLQGEAEIDDKDGRGQACGTREAVLA